MQNNNLTQAQKRSLIMKKFTQEKVMKRKYYYNSSETIEIETEIEKQKRILLENKNVKELINNKGDLAKKIKILNKKHKKMVEKYKSPKEERMKYYKIYFLWNMWDSKHIPENRYILSLGRHYLETPETWIDMVEAEKYLIQNNWNLKDAIKQIKSEKGTLENYTSLKREFSHFVRVLDSPVYLKILSFLLVWGVVLWLLYVLYL